MLFDFGQPVDGIVQIAFVVEDLDQSMEEFSARLGVGPWSVFRDFSGDESRYYGEPSQASVHIALGFGGHMQYELIQPADDMPSVYRDVIQERGYGFHHFGVSTTDFDGSVREMNNRGYEVVFSARVGGGQVAYFDTRDVLPGMTELMVGGPELNALFTSMYRDALISTRSPLPSHFSATTGEL